MKVFISSVQKGYVGTKDFYSFEDLVNFMNEKRQDLILCGNNYYGIDVDTICNYSRELSKEQAEEISACEYEVIIYDDYIE